VPTAHRPFGLVAELPPTTDNTDKLIKRRLNAKDAKDAKKRKLQK
jgi:hypothetical protein